MDDSEFLVDSFDYGLPDSLIAQQPAKERDASRLMHLDRMSGSVSHLHFRDICSFFKSGDLLVLNSSRVFPARLKGRKQTGGQVEIMLLEYPQVRDGNVAIASALSRSSKPARPGTRIDFSDDMYAEILDRDCDGHVQVALFFSDSLDTALARHGEMPLPPYIRRCENRDDRSRYQTVYAKDTGSVAAPTAGLHFTEEIIRQIEARGVNVVFVTLHVGYGTFAPLRCRDIRDHRIHEEYVSLSPETADAINACRDAGGRLFAAGTTSVRTLEFAFSQRHGKVMPVAGSCGLYITPGYRFRAVDAMITNFHLPRSSLLVLVSAFAGRENILQAYMEAVRERYRFYSYGDAMLIM